MNEEWMLSQSLSKENILKDYRCSKIKKWDPNLRTDKN